MTKLDNVLSALQAAQTADPDLDLGAASARLVLAVRSLAMQALDEARVLANSQSDFRKIEQAQALLKDADNALADSAYERALSGYGLAIRKL